MEETDFTNSAENGSKDKGITVVGSENKVQESCNLQPKLDNAIIKSEIKMEDDDSSQSASENEESHLTSGHESCDLQAVLDNEIVKTEIKMEDDDISDSSTDNGSKDEGNFNVGTEGNGQEPCHLEDVLDNTIVKSEIKMEEDDIIDCPIENSSNDKEVNKDVHTESNEQDNIRIGDCVFSHSEIQLLQKLRSRLPLNEIVPEHAGRKHNATTNEMPTEKETTNNSWTKLNNVLFKDGILIDNAKFLHTFIQAALIQKSGQPSILNVKNNTVDTEEKGQETFECSQIEMRNLVVMKEKITVDDTLLCNSAIQSGFNNNAETNENSLNKEKRLESSEVPETELNNTILKAIDTTEDAHIRVSAHPINFDKSSGRYEEVTTAKKFQDVEVESVIQIVRKCSVSLERLPSIEKYCKEPINYPIGVLAALRFQSNEMSAEMNAKGLINDSEAYKTTKENNDFLFINPCGLNNKPEPVDAEMDGQDPLACIVYGEDDILSPEEVYDDDDILSSEEVYDDDDDILSSDVEYVDSKEVQDKVVSTDTDLHNPNQKIEIAHTNYKCNVCGETFTLKSNCQLHLLFHGKMKCLKCHRMFDNGVALKNHMQTNHNEKSPPHKKHLSIHMDKNVHNCSVCHKSFIDHKSLLNHKLIHQFTNSYKCIHCNKSYETIVHLNKHLITHDAILVKSDSKKRVGSDEEVITECEFQDLSDECIDADQDFSDEDDQPLSVLIKQNPSKYNVKNDAVSGKEVSTELEFQDMVTENNGQNPPRDRIKNKTVPISNTEVLTDVKFQNLSDKCSNVNQQKSILIDANRNNKSKNKEVTGQSSAGSDEKVFNDIEFHHDFNIDNAEMDGENTLACIEVYDVDDVLSSDVEFVDSKEVPDKVVSTEKDLHDPNQKMQSAHKNYKCNICDETFTLISKFQLHLLYHRNMKCLKCHRMFDNGVALNNHMQTNHNEEPPPRKKHLSIHIDKKVHNCSACHKSFIDHQSLLNHKLIHQFTNSYKCIHCNKSYDTIVHLNKHMLTHDARPVESDSKEKVGSDEELSTEVFQDVSDRCIDIDQDLSDEDDQPLSVLTKQNPSKYNVKNKAGLGKQVSTELRFQDILTENNGQNPPEDRIKNKTGPVPNTEVSTDVSTEFHQDLNIDKDLSESANHQKNYTCIGCGDMFTTTEELRKHEITHKKYECELCENVYNQYSKYQQHLKYHIDGDKLKCLHCKKLFDSGLTLKCHMQTRNCKQCRKCYCSSAALKTHIQLDHSGIHAYKCTRCDEGFLLAEELDKHSLIHMEKRPHTCQLCYKSFSERGFLKAHLLTHSGKKNYKCTKCSKFFGTKKHLEVHLLTHSGVKDHICNICSKAFRYAGHLRKHLIMHTGIKQYKCPLCDTGFTHINPLKRHLVIIHYGTKEHKCIHCNECFALFPDLVKHYAIHKDPRPYKCKKCPKSFIRQQNIFTHMASHSDVKPLQCEQCGSRFRLPHHLRNHLLTHSDKKRPKRK